MIHNKTIWELKKELDQEKTPIIKHTTIFGGEKHPKSKRRGGPFSHRKDIQLYTLGTLFLKIQNSKKKKKNEKSLLHLLHLLLLRLTGGFPLPLLLLLRPVSIDAAGDVVGMGRTTQVDYTSAQRTTPQRANSDSWCGNVYACPPPPQKQKPSRWSGRESPRSCDGAFFVQRLRLRRRSTRHRRRDR